MGYLLVVYVPELVDAEEQARSLVQAHRSRAVGIYAYSTDKREKTCTGIGTCVRGRTGGFTRLMPQGWMAHHCGRRHPDWRTRLRGALLDYLGINLLAREDTPRVFQNPDGYGS